MIAEVLERRILLAAGELDLAFGELGVVTHPDVSSVETILALPAGGKLLAGGGAGSDGYALTRFNADGSLDTSFGGGDGRVVGTFSADGNDGVIEQITPLPNGKFLVSGYIANTFFDEFSGSFVTNYRYFVKRLLADGSVDDSFPQVEIPSNANSTTLVRSPQALPDGRAVVIAQGLLYGLTDSGTLDPDFGGTGNALAQIIVDGVGRAVVGIHVLPDGKILASDGQTLARFNSDGTLDTSFDTDGLAVHDLGFFGEEGAMQVGDDGSVTVVTTRVSSQEDFSSAIEQHVVRFRADGSLDAGFGDGGHVLVTFPTALTSRAPEFAPDGSVVLSVNDPFHATVNEERAWMRRVKSDGSLDEDFGLVLQRDFQFTAAVVDGQGGLISAGQRSDDFSTELVLTRLAEDDPAAAATLTLSGGVASMQGTAADDRIEFRFTDSLIAVTRNTWGKAFALGTVHQFDADGGGGDDTIIAARELLIPAHFDGGAGRDRLGGGPARDTLVGGAQSDRIAGAGGADLIIGNGGNDVIQGGGGADHIYGGAGNDILLGNGGNDRLNAGPGQNRLLGGAGDDSFFAANGSADTIFADAGHDTADADALLDELHGVES